MVSEMDFVCVGLNHHQAPIEIRERVAFGEEQIDAALKSILKYDDVSEAAIVSTCNRVELYAHARYDALESFLHHYHQLPSASLSPHLYRFDGLKAVTQLFRVATSLDSLIVGEPQILGQVKAAYAHARRAGTVGPVLTRTFNSAFITAKRVRHETRIGQNAVTISFAAVELAERVFGNLNGLRALLVGAGEMAELAAKHFNSKGMSLSVINRTFERAQNLAHPYQGHATTFNELANSLANADVILTSTNAPNYLIEIGIMKRVMRQRRYKPILIIDIAVPRNVDPLVAQIDGVYLYNVDDLKQVIDSNIATRQNEAQLAEHIIAEEIAYFVQKEREKHLAPLIAGLTQKSHAIAQEQLNLTLSQLNISDVDKQKIESMTRSIVNKILHGPIMELKSN